MLCEELLAPYRLGNSDRKRSLYCRTDAMFLSNTPSLHSAASAGVQLLVMESRLYF